MTEIEAIKKANLPQSNRPTGQMMTGLVLLLPAVLCWLTELLLPTVRTIWLSFQESNLLSGSNEFVGLENYRTLFNEPGFGQSLTFTLSGAMLRLLAAAVVPIALAWAASRFAQPVRLGVRILLSIPIVLFVPSMIAIVWLMALNPTTGLFAFDTPLLANPDSAGATLLLIDALYVFGLACGIGLLIYLPLWRRSAQLPTPTVSETSKPLLVVWVVSLLAILALSLSTFTLSFVMTGGGPANRTTTLGLWMYQFGFRFFNFGPAAAIATMILIVTLILGIVAGFLLISANLRLTTVRTLSPPKQIDETQTLKDNRAGPALVLVATLLLILGVCSLAVIPFGRLAGSSSPTDGLAALMEQIPLSRVLFNTLVPPVIAAVVQLLIAYLAALSLGVLRPFGKASKWVLLLFSPWLFVTILPLSLVSFISARDANVLNTFAGLVSPILFSVPSLFILTIFFQGQVSYWQTNPAAAEPLTASSFFKGFIWPSLPLAGVLLFFLIVIGWQDLYWPLLVGNAPEQQTLGVALLRLVMSFSTTSNGALAAAVTRLFMPITALLFVLLLFLQIAYLDKLVLYSDSSE